MWSCSNGWIATIGSRYLGQSITGWHSVPLLPFVCKNTCLWARWKHARLSCSGPGFDPRSGQVSWVRFFQGLEALGPQGPRISSSIIIHYGRQWPEMLMCPKTSNIGIIHACFAARGELHCVLMWLFVLFGPNLLYTPTMITCHINLQYSELVLEGTAFFPGNICLQFHWLWCYSETESIRKRSFCWIHRNIAINFCIQLYPAINRKC